MKKESIVLRELFKPYALSLVYKFFETYLKERKEVPSKSEDSITFSHGRYDYEIFNATEQQIVEQFTKFLNLKAFI